MNDVVVVPDPRNEKMDINHGNADHMIGKPKLLLLRYKVMDHSFLNKYASFCNAIQFPGFINISCQHGRLDRTPNLSEHQRPDIYDYFGYRMENFGQVTIDPRTNCDKFHLLKKCDNDGMRLFQDTNPPFFFIETTLMFQPKHHVVLQPEHHEDELNDDYDDYSDWSWEEHFVPVIYKEGHYYICPSEEKALIYRVVRPEKLFFKEDGHQILRHILVKAFDNCTCGNFRLLLPKRSAQFNVANWDRTDAFQIKYHVHPYPLLRTSTIPEEFDSSVQLVSLDDKSKIKSIDFHAMDDSFDPDSEEDDMGSQE